MTDQFQFEPHDDAQDPDEPEPEQGPVDRLDDERDEGYAPPVEPWSTGSGFSGSTFTGADPDVLEAPAFEERLEHEDPEVEDDWDEDAVGQPEGGGRE